jgi:uncharacterized DUF497 family protein
LGRAQSRWQPKKARRFLRGSGYRLQRPEGLDWDDFEHSLSERRSNRVGFSVAGRILFVVYTIRRLKNEKETVRIISARQATRKERQAYAG